MSNNNDIDNDLDNNYFGELSISSLVSNDDQNDTKGNVLKLYYYYYYYYYYFHQLLLLLFIIFINYY